MLAIGRALMSDPKLLLLDEPSLGLAPLLVKTIFDTVREINKIRRDDPAGGAKCPGGAAAGDDGYVLETGTHRPLRPGEHAPGRRAGAEGLPGRRIE